MTHKLDVTNMKYYDIQQALGMINEIDGDEHELPPFPVPLRRTWKAICPVCSAFNTSIIKGKRRSVCYQCQARIGRGALDMKVKGLLRRRTTELSKIAEILNPTYLRNLRCLHILIVDYLIY